MENNTIKYITEKEVSELTGIALSTLRNHRFLCKGFPYHKTGKSIRYSLQDVIEYMEAHKVEPLECMRKPDGNLKTPPKN